MPRRETFVEREQREKEEREKRSAHREKMKEKERNDELVSNLKVECWELYRCTRRDFDHEIPRRSVIGLLGGYAKEPKELAEDLKGVEGRAREADCLCGDQRDQDGGASGSRSPPAELVGSYPSVNRGTSGRDCTGKKGDNGGGTSDHLHGWTQDGGYADGHAEHAWESGYAEWNAEEDECDEGKDDYGEYGDGRWGSDGNRYGEDEDDDMWPADVVKVPPACRGIWRRRGGVEDEARNVSIPHLHHLHAARTCFSVSDSLCTRSLHQCIRVGSRPSRL